MSLLAYQKLKPSVVEYLDEIPNDWPLKRLGDIVGFAQGKAHEPYIDDDGDYICVNSRFVSTSGKTIKTCSLNLTPASLNDILMVMSDLPNGRALARAYYVADHGKYAVNQRVCRITAEKAHPRFLFYVLDRHPGLMQNDDGVHQTHLSNADFQKLKIYLPSISEQTQIAGFLDHETARIDALIEEQQRLIELLKEKRQAVISHAVTKGLDPTVPMKDSDVEWLGEVPCSWRVIKFGITHDKAELGGNYEAGESEEGLPLIKMGNIGRGKVKLDKVEYVSLTQDIDSGHTLKEGDFLFNTRNSLDLVGKVCVWRSELYAALYNSNILRISFNKSFVGSSGFVNYLLNSNLGLEQLRLIARGTTSVAAIYYKDLSSLSFAFPSPSEQREIERFLDIQTSQLDALVSAAEQTVDVIKERRSALISAAVTGKIDVRGWQPPARVQSPELAQEAV